MIGLMSDKKGYFWMKLLPGVLVLSLPIPIIAGNFEAFHKANQVIILIFINVIIIIVGAVLVFSHLNKITFKVSSHKQDSKCRCS